ncbi:MAG: arsenate reductase ArsC [Syntrophobacteraceae bacterium]
MDRKTSLTDKPSRRVLFLCYGNACRSIIAEALARHFWNSGLEARSAGLAPLGYLPALTLEVLNEAGIPTDGLYSKGLSDVRLDDIDYMVNLTQFKVRELIPSSFSGKLISHFVRDPFGLEIEVYRQVREGLESFVREKLPVIIAAEGGGSLE